MKKLLLICGVIFLLIGCKKTTALKQEYIPIFIDTDTYRTFYVASPSGVIVFSTDSETYYSYINESGKEVNINDFMEAQYEED